MILTDDDLLRYVKDRFGVSIPDVQVCPNHSTPARAFCDAYFARSPVSVWEGSRGFAGKSFLLALLGLTEACTLKCEVNVLGGSGEQSQRVLTHMLGFWNAPNAPRELLASEPAKRDTRLNNGASIHALMASQASVRGPHPVRLRLDEIDIMDIELLDAAMGQPMSKGGVKSQVVMSSTHQNADGTMTEIKRRANEKSWGYNPWCYKETMQPHGWLDPTEVDRKRDEITDSMWKTEYDLQEPSPESRAIRPEAVERMFDARYRQYAGRADEDITIEEYIPGATYATGADWAKSVDWTIIVTIRIDTNPARLVAFRRMGRLPWPVMIAAYNERVKTYGLPAAHDATGLGGVIDDYMTNAADGVIMVGRARQDMLTEYIAAIERGEIIAPMIDFMYGEHKFASQDDIYGSGHLPDTIAAGALAWYAATKPIEYQDVIYSPARI